MKDRNDVTLCEREHSLQDLNREMQGIMHRLEDLNKLSTGYRNETYDTSLDRDDFK